MPMERKCLTDGLVSEPVDDVVGALVLPPALVSTMGCTVTSETVIVSPCAFARDLICSASIGIVHRCTCQGRCSHSCGERD